DAVVVILGFQFDKFEIAYGYDFTVSELGPISGGTHEVSLQYKLATHSNSRTKKKQKYIPCPTFNKK
ncbi:MAG: type IX secretion system membrane protein PorP/SprF, partial [Cyclobacteriaceae bacterium]